MTATIEIPAEQRRQAYGYYVHHPTVCLRAIATCLGVSRTTFFRLRKSWGWPPRRDVAAPSGMERKQQAEIPAPSDPPSLREAARSLAQVTRSHIDALVKEQRTGRRADHDKTARTLASYAKTLATAQALLEQEGSRLDETGHHEQTPRSLHDLHDELARHLERIVAEEEARGGDGVLF